MTQENKELLLKDLTARLPYGVHIRCYYEEGDRFGYYDGIVMNNISNDYINDSYPLENSKPYLRPMSSMTEDEDNELNSARMGSYGEDVDWLNAHHFDYHGLIEKGLALEAPEGMYKEDEIMTQEETNKEIIINLIDFVTEYGDKYYGPIAKADALNWLEQKLSNDTKSKDILIEAYEVGKGTTSCGQDYKCKKDYKVGNCWYIKDVIYHCSRDGYLNDQNGVSWSCTPEWFNEYIYTNSEWADKEKNDFVSGQFLQCKLSFDGFKEGEHYWFDYVGDDIYVGRSDNILNQKFHITPRQLYTLFSQQLEEVQGPPQEEKQVSLNYKPPFDENPSDKEIIEALIKHLKEQDGFLTAIDCVSTKAILSWLEMQKAKERLDRMAPIYNNKESFESALEKAWKYYNESASRTVDSFEDDYIECVFSKGFREGFLYRENQKEQKSVDYDHEMWKNCEVNFEGGKKEVINNPEKYGLHRSAKWSNEEKDKLNSIEHLIVNANAHGNYLIGDKDAIELQHFIRSIVKPIINITEWSDTDNIGWDEAFACVTSAEKAAKNEEELQNAVTAEKWLKEIKFKYYVHPVKQEWSEEDEEMFDAMIDIISNSLYEPLCPRDEMLAWLKKMRYTKKKEKDEAFKFGKHQLAIEFMNYLDENRPEGKMSLSNGECEDIDRAFKENDWAKILRYVEKYGKKN